MKTAWLLASLCGLTAATILPARAGPVPSTNPHLAAKVRTAMHEPADDFRDVYVRQVWLKVMSARLAPIIAKPQKRRKLLLLVHVQATRAKVPPALVLAIINAESNFDSWAVSPVGAQGLMQIMPFWLKEAGKPGDNLFNPQTNVRLGCTILAYYLKRAHGDFTLALQSYYGNRDGIQYSTRVLRLLATRWYWDH